MQKKLSLILLVAAVSSFVPAYGVGTKSGAKKRKKHKMHVLQAEQLKSDDNLTTIDSNSVPKVEGYLVPAMLNLDYKVVGLNSQKNATIHIPSATTPDDKADTIATTLVVEDPKSTELNQTDKKVIILTGLKAFAARVSEKFHSIFS